MKPYYQDDHCTIYHGECLALTAVWDLAGAAMVTDPPYGRAFQSNQPLTGPTDPIVGDLDTTARDEVLNIWGARPAIVFGALPGRGTDEPLDQKYAYPGGARLPDAPGPNR